MSNVDKAAEVLIAHTRMNIGHCHCGWGVDAGNIGQSHALHVAQALADAGLVPLLEIQTALNASGKERDPRSRQMADLRDKRDEARAQAADFQTSWLNASSDREKAETELERLQRLYEAQNRCLVTAQNWVAERNRTLAAVRDYVSDVAKGPHPPAAVGRKVLALLDGEGEQDVPRNR